MIEGVLLGMVAISLVGFYLNRVYAKKYGKMAVQWWPFLLQVIFVGGTLANMPGGNELSRWLIFFLIGLVASYGLGLWKCWRYAKEQGAERVYIAIALAIQILLPLAVTWVLLTLVGIIVFGFLWEH